MHCLDKLCLSFFMVQTRFYMYSVACALNHHYYCVNNLWKLCTSTILSSRAWTWQIPEGNGSGVVWDGQGHIVTNYHGKSANNLSAFACMNDDTARYRYYR